MTPALDLDTAAKMHVEGFGRRRDLERDQPRKAAKASQATANQTLGGLPVAAAETNAEKTGRNPAYATMGRDGTPHRSGVTAGETASNSITRPRPLLRPLCLNRDNCGSGTPDHCWRCKKAAAESEAA